MNGDGLIGKYFVRLFDSTADYEDVTKKFDGVRILKIDGLCSYGNSVSIYTQQWINDQTEDYYMSTPPNVIRKNVDLQITFICGQRYADGAIDVQRQHDKFVAYLTNGYSPIQIKSLYDNKTAVCVPLDNYAPAVRKLQRGSNSFIMGTLTLHCLDAPRDISETEESKLYIGFGESAYGNLAELLDDLKNRVMIEKPSGIADGTYSVSCPSTSYMWICFPNEIGRVFSSGFEVPMTTAQMLGSYYCYRSGNSIAKGTVNFDIKGS